MQQEFDSPRPLPVPAGDRLKFFCARFSALNDFEQALILARLLAQQGAQSLNGSSLFGKATGQMDRAVEIFRAGDAGLRAANFEALSAAASLDTVTSLFLETHQNYFPALLIALKAAYDGHDLGLLTARGNRRGHQALIGAIKGFIGVEIPRRNIYFVNDETRNERLGGVSTAEKKLLVLRNFVEGEYVDRDGVRRAMSKKYGKVFFYDDESKNINTVAAFAMANQIGGRLIAVDAKSLSIADIWSRLVEKVSSGMMPSGDGRDIMHFFDIDGTLIKLDARMYVVRKDTKERLLTVTQEQLAEHSVPYWLAKAREKFPALPAELLEMDFGDFADIDRVRGQVQQGRRNNAMFKRDRG